MSRCPNRRHAGFSLLETIIAMAILAVVFGEMTGVFRQVDKNFKKSKDQLTVYNLAREKLEEYSRIAPLPGNGTAIEDYATIPGFPEFRRVVTVGDYLYPGELKQITVSISWDSGVQTQSFSTLKANYGY